MTTAATDITVCGKPANGGLCQLLPGHLVGCQDDPLRVVPLPEVHFSEIKPRLWMGGSWTRTEPGQFDRILTLFGNAPWAEPPTVERRHPCSDGTEIPAALDDLALWVYNEWAVMHRTVLVRCQAGLNRSGLVIARALMIDRHTAEEAIHLIRVKRSPYALCNRYFELHLRSL